MKSITKWSGLLILVLTLPRIALADSNYTRSMLCSCVLYARHISNVNFGSIGYAKNMPINRSNPEIDAIVVFDYQPYGHLGVVKSINTDGSISVQESNYRPCDDDMRNIKVWDSHIRGYYK